MDKKYAIWWIKHRLFAPSYLYNDIKYWILYRTFKRYNVVKIKSLKPGWWDFDTRLLHSSFDLLVEFVEKGKSLERYMWDQDQEHITAEKEIRDLYDWWKNRRPARKSIMDEVPEGKSPKSIFEHCIMHDDGSTSSTDQEQAWSRKTYPEYYEALDKHIQQETDWFNEDHANIVRLAKLMRYLST